MTVLWAAIVLSTLIACEIALRLPLGRTLGVLNRTAWRSAHVVATPRITDTWKEKVLPAYAFRIMKASLTLLACLVAIALPVIVASALATGSVGAGSAALMRPLPILVMIVVGAGYVVLRRRLAI